ncbi:MAG: hypothetical protein AB7T06_41000 [Kofleriaceae bacterium]
MSVARIIVFALALTHAVGLADLVLDDACAEECADDGCTDCLPGVACRCHCPSAMPLVEYGAQSVASMLTPSDIVPSAVEQRMHASPDPREILRVPKRVG